MMMKVTNGYLVDLANILAHPERIFGGKCSGRTAYKVYMNRKKAEPYNESIMEAFPQDPMWGEYTVKHDAVYAEYKVSTMAELMALPEPKQEEIRKRVSEIDDAYREVIDRKRASDEERNKVLAEEVEVDLFTVTPDEIEIRGDDAWEVWRALYADGKGFIREGGEE